jgi:hypothetical protein
MNTLTPSKAPNLNVAPAFYDQQHMAQLLNQLKLYFQQNDNNNGQLIQQNGSGAVMAWLSVGSF